ncbi:DUF2007 domain-containing protein [Labilibacter sediminis]|nr:DUF2007 domain-containing protein [Labilibacter sediminis]
MSKQNYTKTVKLITCNTSQEANIIKGRLSNEGIYAIITNENFTDLMPHFNGIMGAGVQILVNEDDYERAYELIQPEDNSKPITCPYCHSKNIKFGLGSRKKHIIFQVILSLLVAIPFGNIKATYYCKDCNNDFKT